MTRLEARGLTCRFGAVRAVDGVALSLEAGEVLAVLGASGSGKSTLLRILGLLESGDAGEILIDGARVPRPAPLAVRRRFALAQQKTGLLRLRAWENVAFPLRARDAPRDAARERAQAWLSRLGLADRAGAMPETLSGGEAQRIGLARALVTEPDVLLLDEPTNQLDPETTRLVENVLAEERSRGAAIALVTHNLAQARRVADRFVLMREGRVVADGGVEELSDPRADAIAEFVRYA